MGERLDDLLPALVAFRDAGAFTNDGMRHSECTLPFPMFAPLCRAIMRIEARLLREDANRFTDKNQRWRTPDQRRADAFGALVTMLLRRTDQPDPVQRDT